MLRRLLTKLQRGKAGEANATERTAKETTAATTTTEITAQAVADVTITTDATSLEQKPDLYSTEGFIGMKVVVEPTDADLDIVFVHGLTGNRDTTWTHKNGVFWPRQLGEDLKTARIMTFGYDADVVKLWGMAGSNNLRNHGKNLAFAVSDRRRGCRERPIIFIAHSLGGLVSEQALLICGEGEENLEKVFQSMRGIIFMGTPHAGADLANWGYTLATYLNIVRKTNSAILDPLRKKSDVLTAVQQQFQQSLGKPGVSIKIYCFFEEKAVVGVGVIVPEHSAVLSQYPNQSIAANHMDMTKFSGRNDEGYQRVLGRLQDIMELIEPSTTSVRTHPDYKERTMCHRSLRTSDYERHKDRNPEPVTGTCIWVLQHPNYISWRDSATSSLLWVSADPGCGKSVLSKFLADMELKATRLRTTCYFFFKDDNEDQKTATNALCAILHQLFNQKPELLGHAKEVFDRNGNLTKTINLLWDVLITASTDPQAEQIICILDALDECRQLERRILLQKLCSFYTQRPLSDKLVLKFLVTSRPQQNIEDGFHHITQKIPTIRLAGEENTDQIRDEINLVIEHELTQIQHQWHLDNNAICALREEFAKVENRTYLWLTLIFDLLRQDLGNVTKAGRQKIFGTIPPSVDDAYTAILNKSTDKGQAKRLLQIVCAATSPLHIEEMIIAISIQPSHKTHKSLALELYSEEFSKRFIRNLCGLFVSVIDGRVYFLHQTAKEFLMRQTDDIQSTPRLEFDGIWKHSISMRDSHLCLANICMWYLRLEELYTKGPALSTKEFDQIVSKFGFFLYSALKWTVHFKAAMIPDDHPSIGLALELCNVQTDGYMSWELAHWNASRSPTWCNHLEVASRFGLEAVVDRLLATPGTDVNVAGRDGRTPLMWAAQYNYEAIVDRLLAVSNIDINATDQSRETALWYAIIMADKFGSPSFTIGEKESYMDLFIAANRVNAAKTRPARRRQYAQTTNHGVNAPKVLARLLALPGIDVNIVDTAGASPLWWAALLGYDWAVTQLLDAPGINVNAADNQEGMTPLLFITLEWRPHREVTIGQLLAMPGINVNAANTEGQTPLLYAVKRKAETVIGQLLAMPGINVNAADNEMGMTPLLYAVKQGSETIIGQLLAVPGINVNAANTLGVTPLLYAIHQRREAIIGQLLAVPGINVNAADALGRTPLGLAKQGWLEAVVAQLLAVPGIINVSVYIPY